MEEKRFAALRYLVRLPEGFDERKRYPVLFYLHGAGTRNQMEMLKTNPLFLAMEKKSLPFVCIAPLCEENTWFDHFHDLKGLVREIAALPFADPSRVYLTGLSMGGYGAWQLAISIPDAFAALVPICGGGMYWCAGRLKNLPVWAFHGGLDKTVFPEESKKMVDAVNKKGGNARLTVFPEDGHNAWDSAYGTDELYAWLLSHKNGALVPEDDGFQNAAVYG